MCKNKQKYREQIVRHKPHFIVKLYTVKWYLSATLSFRQSNRVLSLPFVQESIVASCKSSDVADLPSLGLQEPVIQSWLYFIGRVNGSTSQMFSVKEKMQVILIIRWSRRYSGSQQHSSTFSVSLTHLKLQHCQDGLSETTKPIVDAQRRHAAHSSVP